MTRISFFNTNPQEEADKWVRRCMSDDPGLLALLVRLRGDVETNGVDRVRRIPLKDGLVRVEIAESDDMPDALSFRRDDEFVGSLTVARNGDVRFRVPYPRNPTTLAAMRTMQMLTALKEHDEALRPVVY